MVKKISNDKVKQSKTLIKSHGQEKSGKNKKNDKCQVKMWVLKKFRKRWEKKIKLFNFVSSNLPNSFYLKAFKL